MSTEYHDHIEQGSLEWHFLRGGKDTASEAGAVMEVNPWVPRDQRELRAVKDGEIVIEENFAMSRGKRYEDQARGWLVAHSNHNLQPTVAIRGGYLASLDGMSDDRKVVAEIKIPMNYEAAVEKAMVKLPIHYWYQMVQQAYVCEDAELFLFCMYDPDNDRGWVQRIDAEMLRADWPNVEEAWEKFNAVTEWAPLEHNVEEQKGMKMLMKRWSSAKKKLALAKKAEADLRSELLASVDQDIPSVGFGVKITPVTSKGSIDWQRVAKDLDLSDEWLEPYRKADSKSFRITGEYDG